MPDFCDVALPVPLDMAFTYRVTAEMTPVVGGRVLVPFRQQRMMGIVVDLHDRKPNVTTKNVLSVVDPTPVLDDHLLRLGRWIADYYLAPIGEVFRTMLPLTAEFKRVVGYRITEQGQMALHLAGMTGSSARSQRTPEEQATEFRVLDYLTAAIQETEPRWVPHFSPNLGEVGISVGETETPGGSTNGKGTASAVPSGAAMLATSAAEGGSLVREQTLRSATGASRRLLDGMIRKKWITREDLSAQQQAKRTIKVAILTSAEGKLNSNQRTIVDTLAAAGGKIPVESLHSLEVPRTTLNTLVRRGLIHLLDEPADFTVSRTRARPQPFEFDFTTAQKSALTA